MNKKQLLSNKNIRELVTKLINLRRHAVTDDSHKAISIIQEYIDIKVLEIKSEQKMGLGNST